MRSRSSTLIVGLLAKLLVCPALGADSNTQSSRTGRWFLAECDEDAALARATPENADSLLNWGHCAGYVSGLSDMLHGTLSLSETVSGSRNALGICLPNRGMSGGMWFELLRSHLDRHPDLLDTPLRTVLLLASRETFPCAPTP